MQMLKSAVTAGLLVAVAYVQPAAGSLIALTQFSPGTSTSGFASGFFGQSYMKSDPMAPSPASSYTSSPYAYSAPGSAGGSSGNASEAFTLVNNSSSNGGFAVTNFSGSASTTTLPLGSTTTPSGNSYAGLQADFTIANGAGVSPMFVFNGTLSASSTGGPASNTAEAKLIDSNTLATIFVGGQPLTASTTSGAPVAFNFSGILLPGSYRLIVSATTNVTASSSPASPLASFTNVNFAIPATLVPEPSGLAAMSFAASLLARRRVNTGRGRFLVDNLV